MATPVLVASCPECHRPVELRRYDPDYFLICREHCHSWDVGFQAEGEGPDLEWIEFRPK